MKERDRSSKNQQRLAFEQNAPTARLPVTFSVGTSCDVVIDRPGVDCQRRRNAGGGQCRNQPQHRRRGQEPAGNSRQDGSEGIACVIKGFVSSDPPGKICRPDDAE